jgi:hypothetical protein
MIECVVNLTVGCSETSYYNFQEMTKKFFSTCSTKSVIKAFYQGLMKSTVQAMN